MNHASLRSILLSFALVGAACGGSDKPTPAVPTTPTTPTDTATPTTPADGTATPTDGTATPTDGTATPTDGAATPTDGTATPATPAGPSAADQATAGEKVWAEACADCHGKDGKGHKKTPGVVGPKALAKFKTAGELYDFVSKKMPKDEPGTLKSDEYLAAVAWMLKANGKLGDAGITAESAATISLH